MAPGPVEGLDMMWFDPFKGTVNSDFNPEVEPSDDLSEVMEKDEDDIEISLHDSDDEMQENEPSEGGAEFEPCNQLQG